MISLFSVSSLPRIVFGAGSFKQLPELLQLFDKRVLIVTGSRSFRASLHWQGLFDALKGKHLSWEDMVVRGEPSPQLVDQAVRMYSHAGIGMVLGIGGGSVLDAAKAIAGLLPHGNSVMDHLEGVGPDAAAKAYYLIADAAGDRVAESGWKAAGIDTTGHIGVGKALAAIRKAEGK